MVNSDSARIGPTCTVEEIGRRCEALRGPGFDVYARIESVEGRTVVYLVRSLHITGPSMLLRRQGG